MAAASDSVVLKIHKGNSKIIKYNTENTNPIVLGERTVKQLESFTYLDRITDERRGSDTNVKARIGKARTAFL